MSGDRYRPGQAQRSEQARELERLRQALEQQQRRIEKLEQEANQRRRDAERQRQAEPRRS